MEKPFLCSQKLEVDGWIFLRDFLWKMNFCAGIFPFSFSSPLIPPFTFNPSPSTHQEAKKCREEKNVLKNSSSCMIFLCFKMRVNGWMLALVWACVHDGSIERSKTRWWNVEDVVWTNEERLSMHGTYNYTTYNGTRRRFFLCLFSDLDRVEKLQKNCKFYVQSLRNLHDRHSLFFVCAPLILKIRSKSVKANLSYAIFIVSCWTWIFFISLHIVDSYVDDENI